MEILCQHCAYRSFISLGDNFYQCPECKHTVKIKLDKKNSEKKKKKGTIDKIRNIVTEMNDNINSWMD